MQKRKKERKKEPVINGLYKLTSEVYESWGPPSPENPWPLVKQYVPELRRRILDYPPVPALKDPAYVMDTENFEKFVKRLEKLACRAEKVFAHYSHYEFITKGSHVSWRAKGGLSSFADILKIHNNC